MSLFLVVPFIIVLLVAFECSNRQQAKLAVIRKEIADVRAAKRELLAKYSSR